MSDLDDLAADQLLDRAALWSRAADWRARWTRRVTLSEMPTIPDDCLAVLTLPAELLGVGRLAAALTAPDTHLHPLIRRAPVTQGHPPVASFAYVDARRAHSHDPNAAANALYTIKLGEAVNTDNHPTFTLLSLIALLRHAGGAPAAPPDAPDGPLADAVDHCLATAPTAANPAKQLALALHERVPIFWGDGPAAAVAADWAARQQAYAERAAFGLATPDLVAGPLLARYPRYWPNTAYFVHLQSAPPDALTTQVTNILARRRFPTTALTAPPLTAPVGLAAARYWLEFGEWLALYSACLNNVDPADRVPHTLLFSP